MMIIIILIGVAYATASLTGALQRTGAVDRLRTGSGPLTVSAQSLYRSLYDADATAAAAFLSGGAEPPELRTRYQNDIAAASGALARVARQGSADPAALATLTENLPVYTGLIETARTDNRAGYPVGAAYLREASALMRNTLLPAAQRVYKTEFDAVDGDRSAAAEFPWIALPLGVLLLVLLAATARLLTRRTNRLVNIGVFLALLAITISLIWTVSAWGAAATDLHRSATTGSNQVKGLVNIRIAVLEARGDESLTLVARGTGGSYEDEFNQTMNRLLGKSTATGWLTSAQADATDPQVRKLISSAATDLKDWQQSHQTLRKLDDSGKYPEAVAMAIGDRSSDTPAYFNRVDSHLAEAIGLASTASTTQATAAADALNGEGGVVTVIILAAVAAAAIGLQRRIAEYR